MEYTMKKKIFFIDYHDIDDTPVGKWKSSCSHDSIEFVHYPQVWPDKTEEAEEPEPYIDVTPNSLVICHFSNFSNGEDLDSHPSRNILPFLSTIPKDCHVIVFSGGWRKKSDIPKEHQRILDQTLKNRWHIVHQGKLETNMLSFIDQWGQKKPAFANHDIPWNILTEDDPTIEIPTNITDKNAEKIIGKTTLLSQDDQRIKLWHRLYHNEGIKKCKENFSIIEAWENRHYPGELKDLIEILKDALHNNDEAFFIRESKKWQIYLKNSKTVAQQPSEKMIDIQENLTQKTQGSFTILIVDDSPTFIDKALDSLKDRADSCSEFDITISRVDPNRDLFVETLYQIKNNGTIQAVVMDWDLDNSERTGQVNSEKTGIELIKEIKEIRPEIICFLVSGHDLTTILKRSNSNVRVFSKGNYLHDKSVFDDLFAGIIRKIKKRSQTPFFNALQEYAERRVSVFHALPTSSGRSLTKSTWAKNFYQYYGKNYFLAETSNTLAPLDSLLDPSGSLKDAVDLARETFGDTDQTYFVTNGTSTANKIVEQALLKPGDVVLIDRNCHKSHHYGLILCDALPVYLKAAPLSFTYNSNGDEEFTGICKGISTQEILSQLEKNPDAKMLILTNTTFDGYIHNPRLIIKKVREQLHRNYEKQNLCPDEIRNRIDQFIFLFDEAWFAFGYLHPNYRKYTAAFAAQKLRQEQQNVRIYATQSTHKTLCAFRQGSMIHAWDYMFANSASDIEQKFHEAIYTHITTSPNYGILASMDVGRMQANIEGYHLVQNMLSKAQSMREIFKAKVKTSGTIGEFFHLLDNENMGIPESDFELDETRLTFFLKPETGITGNECKRLLLDDHDIQHNKTTLNTILLMCNIGINESVASHVITALSEMADQYKRKRPQPRQLNISSQLFNTPVNFYQGNNRIRDYYYGIGVSPPKKPVIKSLQDLKEMFESNNPSEIISANFVTPYPPGFPILVPGQIVNKEAINFLIQLDTKEIHGMLAGKQLKVWTID